MARDGLIEKRKEDRRSATSRNDGTRSQRSVGCTGERTKTHRVAGVPGPAQTARNDGSRLFSFQPVDPGFFDRPKWINQKFRLTLWCEHSRLQLPSLNGEGDKRGVYDLNLPREWFVKAAPFFKVLTSTLSLVLPVASSATKLLLDDATYKGIEKELDLGQEQRVGNQGRREIGKLARGKRRA